MAGSRYAYIFPLIFATIWGLTFVWSQSVLEVYSPVTMVFIRLTLASVFLYAFVKLAKKLQKFEQKDWWLMILAAFFEPFLYFLGESYGILHSSASFAAIMIALIPLITPLAAWLVLGTRSNLMIVVGLVVSFGGISYMVLGDNFELTVDIQGVLCLSLAVLSAVFYALCIQKLSVKYNNYTIVYYQTILGALMFLPFFIGMGWKEFRTVPFDFAIYGNLLMLAIFGSGVAFICFVASIKQLGAVRTYLFSNLIPIVAAIGAYFLLGEVFTSQKIIGIGTVIFGLFVSQIKWRTKQSKKGDIS
ncbi:MAG: DMT family transporter [Bacteroidales bacterium]|jgi:drug/metabolite transporter (DMT)-like permease|nr:DMT family transporter [Bacteroidales bacterium]